MKKKSIVNILCMAVIAVLGGCTQDIDSDFQQDQGQIAVIPQVLASNLNFPWGIEFVSNTDPDGIGPGSVVSPGNLLVANRGTYGEYANTITQINPHTGHIDVYSHAGLTDYNGTPAVSDPYDVAFLGPFVWIANDARGLGSIAVTDPNPTRQPTGHTGRAGEPVPGPAGSGVFGMDDYGFVVTSVTPRNNAENVSHRPVIAVEFSQPVDPMTVTSSMFQVRVDYSPISPNPPHPEGTFSFSHDYKRVEFVYSEDLAEKTRYRIVVDRRITSRDGVPLNGNPGSPGSDDFVSYFTVSYGNPRVIWVKPENGATWVPQDSIIEVGFSEPIRPTTVSSTAFMVMLLDRTRISGDIHVDENQTRAVFVPQEPLDADTTYMVEVNYRVRDLAGNPLDQVPGGYPIPFISYFSTGTLGIKPPQVHSAEIRDDALTIVFTKDIDPASRQGQYLTVTDSSNNYVPGTIDWPAYNLLTFVATNGFTEGYYDVCIEDVLTDLEGLHLDGNGDGYPGGRYCSSIPSGADRLYVTSSYPEDGATDISVATQIFLNFSKEVNSATITSQSVYLSPEHNMDERIPVTISLNPGNISITMQPMTFLDDNADYVITVTTNVTDLAGNSLNQDPGLPLNPFVAYFRTGPAAASAARILSVWPEPGEQSISPYSGFSVRFTEPVDSDTVNESSFIVSGPEGRLKGHFLYADNNTIVKFQPWNPMYSETVYTLSLNSDVRNTFGNSLVAAGWSNNDFQFETGEGRLLINEIVMNPVHDWSNTEGGDGIAFSAVSGTGEISLTDQWVELFNASNRTLDLTEWRLEIDNGDVKAVHVIGSGDGVENVTTSTDDIRHFSPGAYLVVGNLPVTIGDQSVLVLRDVSGDKTDQVAIETLRMADLHRPIPGSYTTKASEAFARVPNGVCTGNNGVDFTRQSATIGYSNAGERGFGTYAGYWGASIGLVGIGGITAAGQAPDEPAYMSQLAFATHTEQGLVYAIDLDNGPYVVFDGSKTPMGIEFVADEENIPGKGYLFITDPENGNIGRIRLKPSGPVGHSHTRSVVDTASSNHVVFYSFAQMKNPVGIAYSRQYDTLFVALRGNGLVLEMTRDGKIENIFDTGLGTNALGGIDVGDMGNGDVVFITHTGGEGVGTGDTNRGSLLYFHPHP
jgi:hypothetical protein